MLSLIHNVRPSQQIINRKKHVWPVDFFSFALLKGVKLYFFRKKVLRHMQFFRHFLHFLYSLSKVIFYSRRKHEVSPFWKFIFRKRSFWLQNCRGLSLENYGLLLYLIEKKNKAFFLYFKSCLFVLFWISSKTCLKRLW